MAPRVGFEPTTLRLTAGCSAVELPRNIVLGTPNAQVSIIRKPQRLTIPNLKFFESSPFRTRNKARISPGKTVCACEDLRRSQTPSPKKRSATDHARKVAADLQDDDPRFGSIVETAVSSSRRRKDAK